MGCQLVAGRFQEEMEMPFSVLYERGVTQEILSMVTRLNRGQGPRGLSYRNSQGRWHEITPRKVPQAIQGAS